MKWFLCWVVLLPALATAAVTQQDVQAALATVTSRTKYPDHFRITPIKMDDPLAVLWNAPQRTCEVLVSKANLDSIRYLIGLQPKKIMLEGFIAHELSHCVEMKLLYDEVGYAAGKASLMNPVHRNSSELLADIIAIMYWKQYYPETATRYIGTLMRWRKASSGDDVVHATFFALEKALPLIPARVNFEGAVAIRNIAAPR